MKPIYVRITYFSMIYFTNFLSYQIWFLSFLTRFRFSFSFLLLFFNYHANRVKCSVKQVRPSDFFLQYLNILFLFSTIAISSNFSIESLKYSQSCQKFTSSALPVLDRNTLKSSIPLNCNEMSLVVRKPVFGVSDQVRHKPGCTTARGVRG